MQKKKIVYTKQSIIWLARTARLFQLFWSHSIKFGFEFGELSWIFQTLDINKYWSLTDVMTFIIVYTNFHSKFGSLTVRFGKRGQSTTTHIILWILYDRFFFLSQRKQDVSHRFRTANQWDHRQLIHKRDIRIANEALGFYLHLSISKSLDYMPIEL